MIWSEDEDMIVWRMLPIFYFKVSGSLEVRWKFGRKATYTAVGLETGE